MQDRLTPALIEIKRASVTDTGEFEGYASTWEGLPDSYGDIIKPGAFTEALASHKSAGTMPAMLWSHDQAEPIGRWLNFNEDNHGLLARGRLTLGTKRGAEAHALLKDDAIALSIGFVVAGDGAQKLGSTRVITKIGRLIEVSLVAVPANSNAKIISIKKPETPKEFERLLRDAAGFSAREAKRATAGGFRALVRDERQTELEEVLTRIDELKTILQDRG